MLEKLKAWLAPILGLTASLLYMLFRYQVKKTEDAKQALARKDAEHAIADARKEDASASKENFDAQEEYLRLRRSRPDLFPPDKS